MSVDPTGTPDVPPPRSDVPSADPWPTDASISPGCPSTPPPAAGASDHPASPPTPPTYQGAGQAYPISAQPYSGGGLPTSGAPWPAQVVPDPVIAQIGEIGVTSSTVHTPTGAVPLAGSQWHVADYWQSEQKTPTWAIVLAIVGFCVLTVFSLLFLLIKETVHRGTVQVTVTSGPWQYVARIPVTSQVQVQHVHQQVNYVRSLAVI